LPKGPNQLNERLPVEVGAIQVNFCKNPHCQNFGVPATTKNQPRGKGAAERGKDKYCIAGSGQDRPMLRRSLCGQYPTIKSNKAIYEELRRFWKPFEAVDSPACQIRPVLIIERLESPFRLSLPTDLAKQRGNG
jgi:hypothetical protein